MFYILLAVDAKILMVIIGLLFPLAFSTLLIEFLTALPKPIKKFLCFSPCISLVAISIKLLFEGTISLGLFTLMLPLFCISLYGGFAMMDILLSNKKK